MYNILYKVVQTCKSVDEILKCDQTHLNKKEIDSFSYHHGIPHSNFQ